ncbi:MAG: SusD/RagB family nutrient-binding outer membrane lipoprotein [Chitinophagaceae bacterium]
MKNKILFLIISAGLFFVTGCKKGFLDVNDNPNAPGKADPALVLTNALTQTASIVSVDYLFLNGTQNYYGSSVRAGTPGPVVTNNFTSADFANSWLHSYHNLNDYNYIEKGAASSNKWFLVGVAKIMKALNFQMLVDTYNDIPYKEALDLSNITPKYDKGQEVYIGILNQLDSAIAILENTPLISGYSPASADVMFNGNATKWIKFANTLKLRMLLHEFNVSSQKTMIAAGMLKIANDPVGLLGPGESATINPGYSTDASSHLSPLYSNIGYGFTGNASLIGATANSYFIGKLNKFNDPRVGYFYTTNANGKVEGNPLGNGNNAAASYFGGPINLQNSNKLPFGFIPAPGTNTPTKWGVLQSPSQSSIILSSWESLFLQAEAVQRGLLPGNAAKLYNDAVTDNFIYLNVFTDGKTFDPQPANWAKAYLLQNIANVGWQASSTDPLQAILTQKYISLCITAPLESWTDYRRTGYPLDLPFSNSSTRLFNYPYRFIYPQLEYNTNSQNVESEGQITPVSPKIFWMP